MAEAESTAIYWFSGTGNSLAVAKAIAATIEGAVLAPLARALGGSPRPASRLGLVFPVHAFGLPSLVAQFLKRAPLAPDAYVFTVATAAALPGSTHRQAEAILARRGLGLAAGWTVRMPLSFSPVHLSLAAQRETALLAQAETRAAAIANAVREGQPGPREDSPRLLAWSLRGLHAGGARFFPGADRYFRLDEACSCCGLCARVCPVGDITLGADCRPCWNGHCEACYACVQWCPMAAISQGGPLPNRQRYRHRHTRAEEIAAQSLADDGG